MVLLSPLRHQIDPPPLLPQIHAPWYNSNTAHANDGQQMRQTIEPLLHAAKINAVL